MKQIYINLNCIACKRLCSEVKCTITSFILAYTVKTVLTIKIIISVEVIKTVAIIKRCKI